jgi:hypothetical protein
MKFDSEGAALGGRMAHIIERRDISRLIAIPLIVACALLADRPTHVMLVGLAVAGIG